MANVLLRCQLINIAGWQLSEETETNHDSLSTDDERTEIPAKRRSRYTNQPTHNSYLETMKAYGGVELQRHSFSTSSALHGNEWSSSRAEARATDTR